jgi:type I restriction enzyme R subunit
VDSLPAIQRDPTGFLLSSVHKILKSPCLLAQMSNDRPAIPIAIRREVLFEARHHCAVCYNPLPLEQAHVVPWSETHEHSVANLIALCANCHSRADGEKWGAQMLRKYKDNPCILARKSNAPESSAAHMVQLLEMLVAGRFPQSD